MRDDMRKAPALYIGVFAIPADGYAPLRRHLKAETLLKSVWNFNGFTFC